MNDVNNPNGLTPTVTVFDDVLSAEVRDGNSIARWVQDFIARDDRTINNSLTGEYISHGFDRQHLATEHYNQKTNILEGELSVTRAELKTAKKEIEELKEELEKIQNSIKLLMET